jgi:predicted nucleic acid-binding protein
MICVDASVAAKWLFPREVHAAEAMALLTNSLARREAVIAPSLLLFEMTNILRQRMLREGLALLDADRLLARFQAIPLLFPAPPGLYQRALALAEAYGLRAAYDAHYLALAERYGCVLWTADQRLFRSLGGGLPFVREIATYAP